MDLIDSQVLVYVHLQALQEFTPQRTWCDPALIYDYQLEVISPDCAFDMRAAVTECRDFESGYCRQYPCCNRPGDATATYCRKCGAYFCTWTTEMDLLCVCGTESLFPTQWPSMRYS